MSVQISICWPSWHFMWTAEFIALDCNKSILMSRDGHVNGRNLRIWYKWEVLQKKLWSYLHIVHIHHHIHNVQPFALSFVWIICLFSKWCNWFWFCPYPLPLWGEKVTLFWFIKMQRRLRQERWQFCILGKKGICSKQVATETGQKYNKGNSWQPKEPKGESTINCPLS